MTQHETTEKSVPAAELANRGGALSSASATHGGAAQPERNDDQIVVTDVTGPGFRFGKLVIADKVVAVAVVALLVVGAIAMALVLRK